MKDTKKQKKEYEYEKESDGILILEQGKKGLLRFFFGHALLTVILVLIQMGVFIYLFTVLQSHIVYYFGVSTLISVVLLLWVLNRSGNPMFQLGWCILILISPIVGGVTYVIFETNLGSRMINYRLKRLEKEIGKYIKQDDNVAAELKKTSVAAEGLCRYVGSTGAFPVFKNGGMKYFPIGEDMFEEMLLRIKNAKKFIFLEYFIVEEGFMWGKILKVLEEKVKEGVEVRLIYDGLCSVMLLPVKYPKKLRKLGIKCKVFSKLKPMFSTTYNNRDHRKILVVDGEYGFTGGVNLADEYINLKKRFGHWKDTGVMISGKAVDSMTLMFLQMWNIDELKPEDYGRFISANDNVNFAEEQGFVQPFSDNPFDKEQVGKRVYLDIINRAERRVDIMTPYLILDYEMMQALKFAAKRGVSVNIIMPHIPDKKYVFAVSRTFYPELIKAGVHVYEYTPGFVHAKGIVADGIVASVGSINFDYRSLYLHFECGVFFYGVEEIKDIEKDMQETIAKSEEIKAKNGGFKGFWLRVWGALLKVFSPLF